MEKLINLLKRWAELEPERCHKAHSEMNLWNLSTYPCPISMDAERPWKSGAIQFEVQQAIEARGWRWGRNAIGGSYYIVIPKEGFSTDYWEWFEGHEDLLAAYLQAIEATAEVAE